MTVEESWQKIFEFWKNETPERTMNRDSVKKLIASRSKIKALGDPKAYYNSYLKVRQSCKGATVDELNYLAKSINSELPESFIKSLKICNEITSYAGIGYAWLGEESHLLTIGEIIDTYQQFINNSKNYEDNEYELLGDVKQPESKWSKNWIPFFKWGEDVYGVIDLREEVNKRGGIICADLEGYILTHWADSYEDFLESAADSLYSFGEIRAEDIDALLGYD